MKVKINKLSSDAIAPVYSSKSAAGADLYNYKDEVTVKAGETVFIGTGIVMEIPEGYMGLVFARSGLACKHGLAPANKVGVIDSDYRGEITVAIHNHSSQDKVIAKGDRIAQIAIVPYLACEFEEGELSSTERGAGGFGSTGK